MGRQAKFKLFADSLITASQSITSEKISLENCSGYFCLSGSITGADTQIKIEYLKGNGDTFILNDNPVSQNLTQSPFSIQFFPELCESIKIKISNLSDSDINLTASLLFSEN